MTDFDQPGHGARRAPGVALGVWAAVAAVIFVVAVCVGTLPGIRW